LDFIVAEKLRISYFEVPLVSWLDYNRAIEVWNAEMLGLEARQRRMLGGE
jgi:hypothetical protein